MKLSAAGSGAHAGRGADADTDDAPPRRGRPRGHPRGHPTVDRERTRTPRPARRSSTARRREHRPRRPLASTHRVVRRERRLRRPLGSMHRVARRERRLQRPLGRAHRGALPRRGGDEGGAHEASVGSDVGAGASARSQIWKEPPPRHCGGGLGRRKTTCAGPFNERGRHPLGGTGAASAAQGLGGITSAAGHETSVRAVFSIRPAERCASIFCPRLCGHTDFSALRHRLPHSTGVSSAYDASLPIWFRPGADAVPPRFRPGADSVSPRFRP